MLHKFDVEDTVEAFHCITCSDEALPATVLSVDVETGLAIVSIGLGAVAQEIDISLVDTVTPGDVVLVHGGVALAQALQP